MLAHKQPVIRDWVEAILLGDAALLPNQPHRIDNILDSQLTQIRAAQHGINTGMKEGSVPGLLLQQL